MDVGSHYFIQLYYLVPILLVFGAMTGSFLNVVIHRLPIMLKRGWTQECQAFLSEQDTGIPSEPIKKEAYNLAWPNSQCPHCQHSIRAIENIPVISYIALKGKCRHCQAPISMRYPIVESLGALLTLVLAFHFGMTWPFFFSLMLTYSLIALTFIDFDHQLLPDQITLPMLWLGLLVNTQSLFTTPIAAIIGATAGYLSLWSVYQIFKLLTGKEGMGYGDFKLLALFGAWLGWTYLPLIILISAFVGAIVGISLMLFKGHSRQTPIPFGPYLAAAGWIALLWGDTIQHYYFQLIGLPTVL